MSVHVMLVNDSLHGGGAEAVFNDTVLALTESNDILVSTYVSDDKRSPVGYLFSFKHFLKLLFKLIKNKVDVVHFHNYYHYLSPSVLMAVGLYKLFVRKSICIFTAHDYHLVYPNSGLRYYRRGFGYSIYKGKLPPDILSLLITALDDRGIIYSVLKNVQWVLAYKILSLQKVIDCVVCPSHFLMSVFARANKKQSRIVIRNPIPDYFLALNGGTSGCGVKAYSEKSIRFIYWGRVSEEKGILPFLERLDLFIKNTRVPYVVTVTILGDGPQYEELRNLESKSNYISVKLNGSVARSDIAKYADESDVFISPSILYENAPLSILEASSIGLPVIVPKEGGGAELASLTKCYFTLDLESDHEWGKMLQWIINIKNAGITNYIYPDYAGEFNNKNYSTNLQKLYKNLLENRTC